MTALDRVVIATPSLSQTHMVMAGLLAKPGSGLVRAAVAAGLLLVRRGGVGRPNLIVDFPAVHLDVAWRGDPEADAVAANAKHRHLDAVADDDGLGGATALRLAGVAQQPVVQRELAGIKAV